MPHIVIECSANVAEVTEIAGLMRTVHETAVSTGIAPLDALRTRVVVHEHYLIADGLPENRFIAITIRLGAGRSLDDQQRLVAAVLAAVESHLGQAVEGVALSVELNEIDPETRLNANRLRARKEATER